MSGSRKVGGVLGRITNWALLGFAAVIGTVWLVPVLTGDMVMLTVVSGSMEPTLHTGDVVVDRQIPPLEARVGDMVTFSSPDDPGRLLTHRVRDIRLVDGTVHFETRGDANDNSDMWVVKQDGAIGLVEHRLHGLGYVLSWGRGKLGLIFLIVLPALALSVSLLWNIWRRPTGGEPTDAPQA